MTDFFDGDWENENQLKTTAVKKATIPTKKAAAPLGDASSANAAGPAKKLTVEETYLKLELRDQILLRPDTYIGGVATETKNLWVCNEEGKFENRDVSFVPGLFKIFDELLVNASDNKQRDSSMTTIRVDINQADNTISVWNDGKGIPIRMHTKENVWVPTLIFSHLLTSDNYTTNKKKTTGGRNGYGAKLANIFSTEFVVETQDHETKQRFKQVFTKNMSQSGQAIISPSEGGSKGDFTKITFKPDLSRFKMDYLDDDIVGLFRRRVYDIAGCMRGLKVYLNDNLIPIRSFVDYVKLYLPDAPLNSIAHERVSDRWEVCVTVAPDGHQQVSFVNGINTYTGGTHVNHVLELIYPTISKALKQPKGNEIKKPQIKNNISIFVNALIDDPTFKSQSKEELSLSVKEFGSECTFSDKFNKALLSTGIVQAILDKNNEKLRKELDKISGRKSSKISGIAKLDDANEAGGRNSAQCTLILTEGDSAKALAVSGLGLVGRDYYGVFPLRGKLLNVRDAAHHQIRENQEIEHVIKILGLQFNKKYTSVEGLRYGRLMIMTDQDSDGSHIKGLLINFLHHFWPSLLTVSGFLVEFITPIVKATKGKQVLTFFTVPQYQQWREEDDGRACKGWTIKYYKGLGTSTSQEAKEYFSNMDVHQIPFTWSGEDDGQAIDLAFSKKRADDRKEWLRQFRAGTFLDHQTEAITYSEFINKELILFSMADNVRSIPSVVDGFKPSQRKVLFACFKRNLKDEIKVAQLAGYVAEHSAYHHGEVSLAGTIVNMAQNYTGSNNINLLLPLGQFGTRLQGGKDAASARYIFTKLATLTRLIFPANDDSLLNYLDEDGQRIEPEWYMPILPLSLINGCEGIGTGWSSSVPNFSPRDVVANIRLMMAGQDPEPMCPYYNGFTGTIEPLGKADRFRVCGRITKLSATTLEITELPIGVWTQSYKEELEKLMEPNEKDKTPGFIKDFRENHTDTSVHFTVTLSEENMAAAEAMGLAKKFKIDSTISTANMVFFDAEGRIKKYDSPQAILRDFYDLRLKYYQKRKSWLVERLTEEWTRLDNKVRFIQAVIKGDLVISNRKRADLMRDLKTRGYTAFSTSTKKIKIAGAIDADDNGGADETADNDSDDIVHTNGYDYLLTMPLWSLTLEKVQQLLGERSVKEEELKVLLEKSTLTLWSEDLDAFEAELIRVEEQAALDQENNLATLKKAKKGSGAIRKPAAGKGKGPAKKKFSGDSDDDDEDDAMDFDDDDFDGAPKKKPAPKAAASSASSSAAASSAIVKKATAAVKEASVVIKSAAPAAPKVSVPKSSSATASSLATSSSVTTSAKTGISALEDDNFVPLAARLAMSFGAAKPAGASAVLASSASLGGSKPGVVRAHSPAKPASTTAIEGASPAKKKARTAAAATKPKPKTARKLVDSDDDDDASGDEEADAPMSPPARVIAKPRRAVAPKNYAIMDQDDDAHDDDDDSLIIGSDGEDAAPASKRVVKPAAAKSAQTNRKKAVESDDDDDAFDAISDDNDEDDDADNWDASDDDDGASKKKAKKPAAAPKKAAPKAKPAAAAPIAKATSTIATIKPAAAPKPKAAPAPKPASKKKAVESDEDEEFDDLMLSPSTSACTCVPSASTCCLEKSM
ncbi:DNA topoisomerase II [Capsaspora owczarzaki ATCC 30864]|uniref:DNA topoisomerase 2 n=1 Tax=Capsaspora owczarzaki (strain ATCC 30864) TaxID=595528 RepID=A0A0D2X192_CAPO3|nr:DNA topoisomerase II [Capsaspora owczarzaki ATCC 30864]KJE90404.1 DNA topoisomerase II [Capsaspora owczarzaki ATCC 30864]|eukprot:XP_004364588.1 DNA topoisomerase II [Capsaspora owczarzaki ATCC 30864]